MLMEAEISNGEDNAAAESLSVDKVSVFASAFHFCNWKSKIVLFVLLNPYFCCLMGYN